MFVLYRCFNTPKEEYQISAGTKYNVATKQKNHTNSQKETILEIISNIDTINKLKCDKDINEELKVLIQEKTGSKLNNLKKCILLKFLEINSCEKNYFRVCRDCKQMVDINNNMVLGTSSIKAGEAETLVGVKQSWACEECRLELAMIAWQEDRDNVSNYEIMVGKKTEKEERLKELLKEQRKEVRCIAQVSPSEEDFKIVAHIKGSLLDSSMPMKVSVVDEKKINKVIILSLLGYPSKSAKTIRICERCSHFWKNEDDMGFLLLDAQELSKVHPYGSSWTCWKCEKRSPPFVLYVLEKNGSPFEYLIMLDKVAPSKYVNRYVCLELYPKSDKLAMLIVDDLIQTGKVCIKEVLSTTLQKSSLINLIFTIFLQKITKSTPKICKLCRRIFDNNIKELGHFWVDSDGLFSSDFICKSHAVKSILFWNMTGWKTMEKIKPEGIKLLLNADIVNLIETHFVTGMNVDFSINLANRTSFNVLAEKRSHRGRGSGGTMVLIKDQIKFKLTRLQYSRKGLFLLIHLPNESLIVGTIYWKPEPGEDESITDWLDELDNFISAHRRDDAKFIIGGDFNGRIKEDDSNRTGEVYRGTALGKKRRSSDKTGNKRGRLLVKLMERHQFVVCNGRTKSDSEGRSTSRTVNGESVVDYIWVSTNLVGRIQDMTVVDIESSGADFHRGLLLKLKSPK